MQNYLTVQILNDLTQSVYVCVWEIYFCYLKVVLEGLSGTGCPIYSERNLFVRIKPWTRPENWIRLFVCVYAYIFGVCAWVKVCLSTGPNVNVRPMRSSTYGVMRNRRVRLCIHVSISVLFMCVFYCQNHTLRWENRHSLLSLTLWQLWFFLNERRAPYDLISFLEKTDAH